MDSPSRVFLLSPAHCGGKRAQLIMNEEATFPLARRLRSPEGAPLGETFAFLSGLYFRGKLAYAERFAGAEGAGPLVITANRGLVPAGTRIGLEELRAFGTVDIHPGDERYRGPLVRDAATIAAQAESVVLLGSVATGKYVDVLLETFGARLLFPSAFVGRGDMSRGALLLRAARAGRELDYQPVVGATRRGPRPARIGSD
ncbi:MAG TPA: hypothetical protein VFU00_01240 [Gemmatimonadales bacterium]|nr:hypothetical protein [Gemmatimonadales bacterium]